MVMVRLLPLQFATPRRLGLGLISQGGISLAMAISGVLTYSGLRSDGRNPVDLLLAVVVLGVILSELSGPFLTRNILVRAGEIHPPMVEAPAAGRTETTPMKTPYPDGEST
jgi:hypothetical protein